ncbi:MAG: hypothetical protein LBV60_06045 [Streptomyces sp.]|jgi:hypothetical protein|nr:hypothetical protein [Streptomyces sp.]
MPVATFTAGADLQAADGATTTAVASATLTAQPEFTVAALLAAVSPSEAVAEVEEVARLAAGKHDLYIEQGATFVQTYTVVEDGWTWDGWTARAQIRSAPADNGAILLDLGPHLAVAGQAVQLVIPATITQALTRNGVWDLEMVKDSTVVRLLQGKVTVSLEVTR